MLLGIDVGGTHTDAVIINQSGVLSTFKAKTDHHNLLNSINSALREVTSGINPADIKNVNLSTTLSTNAIIENKLEKTGLFISAGPGIDPGSFAIGDTSYILEGSINHRGTLIQQLDSKELERGIRECADRNISVYAAVTKFSTRNQSQENEIAEALKNQAEFISTGHRLSSQLSFPRRVATAFYNAAVWRIYNTFINAVTESLQSLGITAPVNILKADGGTMPLELSRVYPVESILSGPAASIMGIIALSSITEDSVILDVGGTTTDIAIFAAGAPLIEREGIKLGTTPTLVKSLQNRSIGIGGDSEISVNDGIVTVGPLRKGTCMADCGDIPTLIDALNFKGVISYLDTEKSVQGINSLASQFSLKPGKLADDAVSYAVKKIKDEIETLISEINQKPVYTIHEMLEGKKIVPKKIYIIGGPARALSEALSGDVEVLVPENYEVANAIGAALARTTIEADLFADTGKEKMIMPSLNIEKQVSRKYTLAEAEKDAAAFLADYLESTGQDSAKENISIVESSSFRMINDFYASGNDIRVKCQIKPGVIMNLHSK